MKYRDGDRPFEDYLAYLNTVKAALPAHAFAFASDVENHDLQSPNSLHDARLERLTVLESREPKRPLTIEFVLLGQRHDRRIHLTYKNVTSYSLTTPEAYALPPRQRHGDVLVHELTVPRDGLLRHEVQFSRGTIFLIDFADLEHRVEMLTDRR